MSKGIVYPLILLLGIFCGAAVSYRYLENKFKILADEEIESVKSAFLNHRKIAKPDVENKEKTTVSSDTGSIDYCRPDRRKQQEKTDDVTYPITEGQFGEFEDYEKISLTCFTDGVLTDEDYERIEANETNVGKDFMLFLPAESDFAYIRNDDVKTDYEIVLDGRSYEELCADRPYLRGS
ncbi:MAG: hypothetical protein NC120_12300 [Ruminococcus sp.]|nr:hypothetical protein [Ruminococcus sp.]